MGMSDSCAACHVSGFSEYDKIDCGPGVTGIENYCYSSLAMHTSHLTNAATSFLALASTVVTRSQPISVVSMLCGNGHCSGPAYRSNCRYRANSQPGINPLPGAILTNNHLCNHYVTSQPGAKQIYCHRILCAVLNERLCQCVSTLDYDLLNNHLDVPTDENFARLIRERLDMPGINLVGVQSTRHEGADLDCAESAHIWRLSQQSHRVLGIS
jgi:hypothetical protein